MTNAKQTGLYLKDSLAALSDRYGEIGSVRGAGLFIGLDLVEPNLSAEPDAPRASNVINTLRQNGVLIGAAGKYGNTLKIRPPLCFGKEHADYFLEKIEQAIKSTR